MKKTLLTVFIPIILLFGINEVNTYYQIQRVKAECQMKVDSVYYYIDRIVEMQRLDREALSTDFEECTVDTAEINALKKIYNN